MFPMNNPWGNPFSTRQLLDDGFGGFRTPRKVEEGELQDVPWQRRLAGCWIDHHRIG